MLRRVHAPIEAITIAVAAEPVVTFLIVKSNDIEGLKPTS